MQPLLRAFYFAPIKNLIFDKDVAIIYIWM
jgi:hypothetical protein